MKFKPFYHCLLDAFAWTAESEHRYATPPSLRFWESWGETDKLLAQVYFSMDESRSRDRWIVQFYPLDADSLPAAREDGYFIGRMPLRRVEPLLDMGELRFPRNGAAEAIKFVLSKFDEDGVSKDDLAAVETVAEILRPPLERLTNNYVTRFRPRQT